MSKRIRVQGAGQPPLIQDMGLWLSRLERTPDKREVGGSSPLRPTTNIA